MSALDGRVVIVTGGSTGIGRACAAAVLAAGAHVVIAARGEAALRSAAGELEAEASAAGSAGSVLAVRCDIADESAVTALVQAAEVRFGAVDGLVHAAAVIGPIGSVLDVAPADWLEALRVDLFGTFLVARAVAASMARRDGGRMVLLSGGGATSPFPNYSAYAASKAGVVRLAETLAVELAPLDIAVNALAPGFVATRLHEATLAAGARAGEAYVMRTRQQLAEGGVPPTLAAAAAVFLLSEASAGVTGRLLAVPWDDWSTWPAHAAEIAASDLFTLRRIVPADRGAAW